jgi:hypothetical protein
LRVACYVVDQVYNLLHNGRRAGGGGRAYLAVGVDGAGFVHAHGAQVRAAEVDADEVGLHYAASARRWLTVCQKVATAWR